MLVFVLNRVDKQDRFKSSKTHNTPSKNNCKRKIKNMKLKERLVRVWNGKKLDFVLKDQMGLWFVNESPS